MKYSKETLRACIRGMLESNEKSGVPLDGQVTMLTNWVEGIIEDERTDALEQDRRDRYGGL